MKKTLIGGVLVAGALLGAAPVNATPMPEVCDAISKSLAVGDGYTGYLLDSWAWGQALNANPRAQAENIVDSVLVYCPIYAPGIRAAAQSLTNSGSTVL